MGKAVATGGMLVALVASVWLCGGCHADADRGSSGAEAKFRPATRDAAARRVLEKAIAAAGGWRAWSALQDVMFVSTLTIFDSRGDATSETIFLHKQPLHRGPVIRMESIGLREEILFGYDGHASWMLRAGKWVREPEEKMFTEFHGVSSVLSFGLPFVLAETPGISVEYGGQEADEQGRWEKLRVTYAEALHSPIRWAVLYFDQESGLLDHLYAQVEAPFLRHPVWLGRWRHYREVSGIRLERLRSFYPADPGGVPVAGLAAEQLIEHVQFNVGLDASLFKRPAAPEDASLAATVPPRRPVRAAMKGEAQKPPT